jgi:hypothetical protein
MSVGQMCGRESTHLLALVYEICRHELCLLQTWCLCVFGLLLGVFTRYQNGGGVEEG